jgi:pentatricopeptide repeat protein
MWGKLQQPNRAFEYFDILNNRADIHPNVTTYTIIIDMFSKMQQTDNVNLWFNKMSENNIQPNSATYNILIGINMMHSSYLNSFSY